MLSHPHPWQDGVFFSSVSAFSIDKSVKKVYNKDTPKEWGVWNLPILQKLLLILAGQGCFMKEELKNTEKEPTQSTKKQNKFFQALTKFKPFRLLYRFFQVLKDGGWQGVTCRLQERRQFRDFLRKNKKMVQKEFSKEAEQRRLTERQTVFDQKITFSILVPLYNTPIPFLKQMIASVQNQTYPNWELCLADGSDDAHSNVGTTVLRFAKSDPRIRYQKLAQNLGISENTNACIAMATGEYLALFDHDDVLHPSALFEMMQAICQKGADFIYTDEATFESPKIEKVFSFHYKPDYAPDNLRANNYICHFSAFRREVLEQAGPFRKAYDGSQDHDMILRLTACAKQIVHIPKVLYFWRSHPQSVAMDISSKTYAIAAGKNAVKDHIFQSGYLAQVESSRAFPVIFRIRYEIKKEKQGKVSILIPNKDQPDMLCKCITSILERTTYPDYEILIIDNNSQDESLFAYYRTLEENPKIRILSYEHPFNYSAINNFAAANAKGEYLLLLNNDIEIITPAWIEEMLMYVQREDVGAAGAMLYYPNDTIQHAGIILGLGKDRIAGHAFYGCPKEIIGYMGRVCYAQNMSAVTAACLLVKKSVYDQVGGLDESYPVAFNDVDFCLRIRKAGHLIVWTPYAEAYHYESLTRGKDNDSEERTLRFQADCARFKEQWSEVLAQGDPYYNPAFSLDDSFQ